jgi:aldehyde:ferredoxin oxidoreductase
MIHYKGYMGKILKVDLSKGVCSIDEVTDEMARLFIGGNGFAAKLMYDYMKPKIDPFSPENKVIFMTGPIQGTLIPCSGRVGAFTKSPLTFGFFDSYAGGYFGPELKFAGYDGIIIEGKSEKPVYLWINDGSATIKDASHIWGKFTFETQEILKKDLNEPEAQIACIGPAGEKLVRVACIILETRTTGRGGIGAVLGSKNLKAIVACGSKDVEVADPNELEKYLDELYDRIYKNPGTGKALPSLGTPGVTTTQNSLGILGTRNWQTEVFEDVEGISGETMRKKIVVMDKACFSCPIRCTKLSFIKDYELFDEGPEYETIFALGSNCGVAHIETIAKGDRLCDEYGMDTISIGGIISFAMECYEKGILTKKELNGLELHFGNDDALLKMIEKIGRREGIGDVLAEGVKIASQKIGKGSEKYAIHVKGLEMAGHSPRGLKGFAIGVATATRGGTHQNGRPTAERIGKVDRKTIEGKAKYAIDTQTVTALQDSLIMCRMLEGVLGLWEVGDDYTKIIKFVTGMEINPKELVKCSERVYNLERVLLCREGYRREHDILPLRFMEEPIPDGASKGMYCSKEELEKLKDEYYEIRGWDKKTGIPSKEKLLELGLKKAAEDLWG